jgi:DNA-binding response OmpR family regulator
MKLLVVEDEPSLLQSITEYFEQEFFVVDGAGTYNAAIEKIETVGYACIILDINLPDGSGLQLLQQLRRFKKDDGVIVISARNSVQDKIDGLNLGADDYISKPFHLSELNARVKALIRRKYGHGVNMLQSGNLELDLLSRTATCSNQPLVLTKNEYDLLAFLLNNKNRVVSKQAIAEHIYGDQADNMPSFDFVYSHIKNLKKKLKEKGCDDIVQTVYGLGYKVAV